MEGHRRLISSNSWLCTAPSLSDTMCPRVLSKHSLNSVRLHAVIASLRNLCPTTPEGKNHFSNIYPKAKGENSVSWSYRERAGTKLQKLICGLDNYFTVFHPQLSQTVCKSQQLNIWVRLCWSVSSCTAQCCQWGTELGRINWECLCCVPK